MQVIDSLPFSSELMLSAALVGLPDGEREIIIQGAPDRILTLCGSYYHENAVHYEVLPVYAATAQKAAEILRSNFRKPHRGEWADAVIAATAILNGLTLVTFNIRHYPYHGLAVYPMGK